MNAICPRGMIGTAGYLVAEKAALLAAFALARCVCQQTMLYCLLVFLCFWGMRSSLQFTLAVGRACKQNARSVLQS